MSDLGDAIRQAIAAAGFPPPHPSAREIAAGGGCVNSAFVLRSPAGAEPDYFVKANASPGAAEMFGAEADGLRELAAAGTPLRIPAPICAGTCAADGAAFLVLEAIDFASPTAATWSEMGAGLAALHRVPSPEGAFGWHRDNTIGPSPQKNPWTKAWADFFADSRLGAQFDIAARAGNPFADGDAMVDAARSMLADHRPETSLLHGDLWSGNAGADSRGAPVVFDPAVYFGDRECDLAFTEMFGGFPRAFYEAYDAAWLLGPGCKSRRPLYNLYHLVNHANLFGGSYRPSAENQIQQLLRR